MYICELAHMCTYYVHVGIRSQCWVSISISSPYFPKQSLSVNLDPIDSTRLANQYLYLSLNYHYYHHPCPSTGIMNVLYHIAPGFYIVTSLLHDRHCEGSIVECLDFI